VQRHIPNALAAVALILAACAEDGRPATDVTTSSKEDDVTPHATSDETPPDGVPPTRPPTTLELAPPKSSSKPVPSTTAGEPIGGDESLYPGRIEAGLAPFIDIAITDLASRLGVDPAEITTISATLVTWSDGSMGCPLPDMQYAQVLQDGSLIELGYGAKVYRYHSGGDRTPFLCDQPLAAPPITGGAADG